MNDIEQAAVDLTSMALDLSREILDATDSVDLARVIADKPSGLLAAAIMFALATAQYEGSQLAAAS